MRDITAKSVKLNRDLDRYVEKGLEEDRPVKIGWGQAGDERPKEGEIGVITHLPEGARVLCLGTLGECAGAINRGGTFTLRGSASSMLGAFHVAGRTLVEKDAGDKVGYRMAGGSITVQGSVGNEAGAGMTGGTIIIRGHTGSKLGAGMAEGTIVVMGSVGSEPGVEMSGGRLIVSGSCPPPGQGVIMRSIENDEISEFSHLLEPLGLSLNEDALVLEASKNLAGPEDSPEVFVTEGFERVSLAPSNEDRLSNHGPLDHYTLILPTDADSGGVLFPVPWLVQCDTASEWKGRMSDKQPALVQSAPRATDLLLVGEEGLADSISVVGQCAGIVLDLSDFPGLNDAEIEALLVSLYSRMSESSLVLLRGNVDRVEHLFRLIVELDLDGAIVDGASPGGARLASALPKIGLASRAMGLAEHGKYVMIEIDESPSAEDMLIAVAAGCPVVVAPPSEEDVEVYLTWIEGNLRGWMRELGIDGLERIGRRNLRATDYDTAAISGLRLIGYDRPLPMWLELR